MNKTFILLLVFIILMSCSDRENKQDLTNKASTSAISELLEPPELKIVSPDDSLFTFYPNCKISSDKTIEREQGDKFLFHYYYKNTDYVDMADEEYYEEIQFEIHPEMGRDEYFTNDPSSFNTTFNWGCFCDWPDSLEASQNEGEIEVLKLNDTIWNVKVHIKNKPFNKSKSISKDFKLYKPRYELARGDTINKTDKFNRKQGHWITEDYFSIKNGLYTNNRFSGSIYNFMYYKDRKTLSSIWIFVHDKWVESLKFDKLGKRIK